jgi:hypothetical protein
MQRFPSLFLSTAFLLGLTPLQHPQVDREQKPVLPKTARLENKKLLAQMQGAWRLVQMKLVDQDSLGLSELAMENIGFCLVSGSYLSIELHVRRVGKGDVDKGRSFVTGLHRFDLEEDGNMETTTVIATRANIDGMTEFEAPGTTRQYSVGVVGDSMTLVREDGHTLIFERLLDDRTRVDFFGRPVTEKDDASDDQDENGEKKDDEGDGGDDDGQR